MAGFGSRWTSGRWCWQTDGSLEDRVATDIFISHAAVDEEIALSLKSFLHAAYPKLDIFVSSDPGDIKPGDEWVKNILIALESSNAF